MRYILGVIAVIFVAFLAIFAIVGRNTDNGIAPPDDGVTRLSTLSETNAEVSLTTRGHLTGDDTFHSIRIRVSATSRTVEILTGYNLAVERSQSFANNQAAFTNLLFALDNAGYLRSQTARFSDSRGVCPMGMQYIYRYTTDDNHNNDLWSTSCNKSDGNFAGSASQIRQIMQNQITGYSKFVSGVAL